MERIILGHGEGKTTKLIKMSHNTKCYIVCQNHAMVEYITRSAKTMGYNILYPLTYEEFICGKFEGKNIDGLLIDEIDELLKTLARGVEIKAITVTK